MRKKVLLIGGCGFIGSHFAEILLDNGYQVIIFDKSNVNKKNIELLKGKIDVIEGDFLNEGDIKKAIKNMDYIVHLVYTTLPGSSMANICYDIDTNVIASIRLLNLIKENKHQKIIFISSGGTVYGEPIILPITESHPTNPICSYGITKLIIEKYILLFNRVENLNYLILRISNLYGKRYNVTNKQGLINVCLHRIANGQDIEVWGDGSIIRDYIYIKDVSEAFIKLIDRDINNEIFNIGTGIGYSINQVIDIIKEVVNQNFVVRHIDARHIDVKKNILNIDKINKQIKWFPKVDLKEGIKLTWEWEKNEKER